jgi:hypothetical protein
MEKIAGIAVIARHRRNRKDKNLNADYADDTDRNWGVGKQRLI